MDQNFQNIPQVPATAPDDNRFVYQNIDELLDIDQYPPELYQGYAEKFSQYAPSINEYAMPAYANLNTPYPDLSAVTYNPYRQQQAPDLNTSEGVLRYLKDTSTIQPTGEVKIANPIYSGIKSSNFERYYEHPEFARLGWSPYADMESYYNANSTWWDDASRMIGQFGGLAKTGFLSGYRAIGDLFENEYTAPDLISAREFSDAMAIGNSTRGGVGGFANNLMLQSAYTFGIIGSVALEELALWGASAVTFGGAAPLATARTGQNIARVSRAIMNTFGVTRLTNATRNMLRTFNTVDQARDLYNISKGVGKGLGNLILPETMAALKTLNTTKNAAQNVTNLGKVARGFGGFYRDVRSLNYAFAESKMEGGMGYDEALANGYALQLALNNGQPLTDEQITTIENNASRSAFARTLINVPIIYLTNQLTLGTAFGSYNKSLARALNNNISGAAKKLIRSKGARDAAGNVVESPFINVGDGFKAYFNRMKSAGVQGSLKSGAHASLRYFSANLGEGVQEIAQEAIAYGTKEYYTNLLKDPASGGYDVITGTIASAVASQFTAQGFETFMSGFLMGGIVQGPQKLLFEMAPNLYQRTFEKEKYEEYKKNKKNYEDALLKTLNEAYDITAKNPLASLFDVNKIDFISQKNAGEDVVDALANDSQFDYQDAKDVSRFNAIYKILDAGKAYEFKKQFEDYLKLTDQELVQAFPSFKQDIQSGKVRARFKEMINTIDSLEESYEETKNRFENPFDPSAYLVGSREYQEEYEKYLSFEHFRYLYMFTQDGFKRALERNQSIFNELASDPLFEKMAASDITLLLDGKSLDTELDLLSAELQALDPKENADIVKAKRSKLDNLLSIKGVLYNPENLNKDGSYNKTKINKLRTVFETYVKDLASSNNNFADKNKIDEALKKLFDYKALDSRARAYNRAIEYMNNPEGLNQIFERTRDYFKNIYKDRKKVFEESVKNYLQKNEINHFLNALAKLDVYPDFEQVKKFMNTGDINVLQDFYNEAGTINPISDKVVFDEILRLIDTYKTLTAPVEEKAKTKEPETKASKVSDIVEDGIVSNTPAVVLINNTSHPVLREMLNRKYSEYSAKSIMQGIKPKAMSTWFNSSDANKFRAAYTALKKLWYNDLVEKKIENIKTVWESDQGFIQWLENNKYENIVQNTLYKAEVSVSDFIPQTETKRSEPITGKIVSDNKFNSVVIVEFETVDEETGETKPYFEIRSKTGEEISEEVAKAAGAVSPFAYATIREAEKIAAKIDLFNIDQIPFVFANTTLSFGSIILDKRGNKYIVISTKKDIDNNKDLAVLPYDKIEPGRTRADYYRMSDKLTVADFTNNYKSDTFDYNKLPANVTKIDITQPIQAYPYKADDESPQLAEDRLRVILEILTPEDLAKSQLLIARNPEGGKPKGKKLALGDKEENPFIKEYNELFTIGIALTPDVLVKVNAALTANNIAPLESNTFAYLRNNRIKFEKAGKDINPEDMSEDMFENIFNKRKYNKDAYQTAVQNFYIQKALIQNIELKLKDQDSGIFSPEELGVTFSQSSSLSYKTISEENTPFKDLKYTTVDGVKVIVTNERVKGGTVSIFKTNIQNPREAVDFEERLKAAIPDYMLEAGLSGKNSQRYVAIVKLPNGQYALVPLKSKELSKEKILEIEKEIIKRALDTVTDNKAATGDVADLAYNNIFNAELNRKFYISTDKNGYDVEINVTAKGGVEIELFSRIDNKKVSKYIFPPNVIAQLSKKENPDLFNILIDTFNNKIKEENEKYVSNNKKNKDSEIPAWTNIKVENVRENYSKDVSLDYIFENSITPIKPEVRKNFVLRYTMDGNSVQEAKATSSATVVSKAPQKENDSPSVADLKSALGYKEEAPKETSEKVLNGIEDIPSEAFEGYAKDNFISLPSEILQQIANKKLEGKRLSQREQRVLNNADAANLIAALESVSKRESDAEAELTQVRAEIEEIKARYKSTITGGNSAINKAINADPEYIKLKEREKKLRDESIPFKLLSKGFDTSDVEHISIFKEWAKNNLPDFITIDDIENLGDNLITNGVRVGAFAMHLENIAGGLKLKGTIYTGATNPFRYHEAFHAVYRSLLTNAQQDKLYRIAKAELKNKLKDKYDVEKEKLRNSADQYQLMSDEKLDREFVEEYMADEFEKFKKNPKSTKTDSAIKNFFNRLIEWIKSLFGIYTTSDLKNLFRDIDSGKFKSASPIVNRFTDSLETGITFNANKVIPVEFFESETGSFGYRILDNTVASGIINAMAARIVKRRFDNTNAKFNLEEELNKTMDLFTDLYDSSADKYQDIDYDKYEQLLDVEKAFLEYSDKIKEAVLEKLQFFDIKDVDADDQLERIQDMFGAKNVREISQYEKDVSSIGGWNSLSQFVRQYIGTTSLFELDVFGNEFLVEPEFDADGNVIEGTGEKILVPVDFSVAYNGFLKAAKNQSNSMQVLQQLYHFGINNPQTKAVVDRLFADLGIQWEGQVEIGELPVINYEVEEVINGEEILKNINTVGVKSPLLFQAILKGFDNYRVDYIFAQITSSNKLYMYTAANRDDVRSQLDVWAQAFFTKRLNLFKNKGAVVKELGILFNYINNEKVIEKVENETLIQDSEEISRVLAQDVGIQLSPMYIQYSILKNVLKPTDYQQSILNAYKDEAYIEKDDIYYILIAIEANSDLFTDNETEVKNRLRRLAVGNAAFDENVGASVFKNPNGDFVYAHQLPTYHLQSIFALNDPKDHGAKLEKIKEEDPFLKRNMLLNSAAFKQMSAENKLKITRLAGYKKGDIEFDDDGIMKDLSAIDESETSTFGDLTKKQFMEVLINTYMANVNSRDGEVDTIEYEVETEVDGKIVKEKKTAALAPILIRVLEASNTGDLISLPVIQTIVKGKDRIELTDEALDMFLNNIITEFERIQKESNPETATQKNIVKYNAIALKDGFGSERIVRIEPTDENVDKGAAYNFHKTRVLLEPKGYIKKSFEEAVKLITSEDKYNRIKGGQQSSLIYSPDVAKKRIGFSGVNDVAKVLLNFKSKNKTGKDEDLIQKNIIARGLIQVTDQNRNEIFKKIRGSFSDTKYDQFKYYVKINDKVYYAESKDEADFIKGEKAMYLYDIIDDSQLEDIVNESKKSIKAEGYDPKGYHDQLLKAARNPENFGLSFDEVISKIGINRDQLKKFLSKRLFDEFNEFYRDINDLKLTNVGTFLEKGAQDRNDNVGGEKISITNKLLNLKPNEPQYNLMQIFFNDYLNTISINQILRGDVALSLKDAVDEIKRAKGSNGAGNSAESLIASPQHGITKPVDEIYTFALTEALNRSSYKDGDTQNADAQAYTTVKSSKHFDFGFGKLSPSLYGLYRKIENGYEILPDEIFGDEKSSGYAARQEMLNSRKLQYQDKYVYEKMSVFILLPEYTSYKDENGEYTIPKPNMRALHNLRIKMEAFEKENDTLTIAAPRSALKMLQENISNIHEVTGSTTPLSKEQAIKIRARNLRLQVINPSNKIIASDPNQVKTLVTSEQNDATEVSILINGKLEKTTIGAIRSYYHKAINDRNNLQYISKRNLVFNLDYAMDELNKSIKQNEITADLITYLKYAEAALGSSGTNSHLMELFSYDENGQQKYKLNNPLTYPKYMSLFMSYFSKGVFREKIPAVSSVIVSDFGHRIYRKVYSVDENGMPDRQEVIPEYKFKSLKDIPAIEMNIDDNGYPGDDNNLSGLADLVKNSKGKGVLIIDRLRHNMKEYDADGNYTGQRYGEMIMPPHHKEVMSELQMKGKSIPDILSKMFAVRIPSQDNHSTYNAKWVDFMPAAYGSVAIFAREIIEISGADFDIDKVYMQFKEFYQSESGFKAYGNNETLEQDYADYIHYVNKNVKKADTIYGEALYKYSKVGSNAKNELNREQIKDALKSGFSKNSLKALSVLYLPRTSEEYKAYRNKMKHEPYSAPINNEILDYKFALMGNDHVTEQKPLYLKEVKKVNKKDRIIGDDKDFVVKTGKVYDTFYVVTTVDTKIPYLDKNGVHLKAPAISYEAADLAVLEELWNELQEIAPELAEAVREDGIDVDNMFGKNRMFSNNKEGARSIGAVVLPNLYLNILKENNISTLSYILDGEDTKKQISFNNVIYNKFSNNYEVLANGGEGDRTQYILSALITAATDNAKERLLAKLGLNINALAIVANLTGLGVPIKTSILLVNNPFIKYAYKIAENSNASASKLIKEFKEKFGSTFLSGEDRTLRTVVTDEMLLNAINNPIFSPTITNVELEQLVKDNSIGDNEIIELLSIFDQFLLADNLASTTSNIGTILSLTSGLGQNLADIEKIDKAIKELKIDLSDEEFDRLPFNEKPVIDVRSIFKGNNWQAGLLDRYNQLTKVLMPKIMLPMSDLFKTITSNFIDQTSIEKRKKNRSDKIKNKVVLDFLSYLTIKAYQYNALQNNSQMVATLNNSLIYPEEGVESVVDVVRRLRELKENEDNYFLNSFLVLEEATSPDNKTGMNLASANTFIIYNDKAKQDIQNGFVKLYLEPETRKDAIAILNYIMVKDGLQYGYKSIVQALAPVILSRYFNQINNVEEAMLRPNDTVFQSTFGMTVDELIEDFNVGYLSSATNAGIIPNVNNVIIFSSKDRKIKVESEYSIANVKANPEITYVFGDNEAGLGLSGNNVIRDEKNAIGIVLKKGPGKNQEDYYTDDDYSDFLKVFQPSVTNIKNLLNSDKMVVFPKELISKEDLEIISSVSKEIYKEIVDTLSKNFNYDITYKSQTTNNISSDPSIKARPMYINNDTKTLVVNLGSGLVRTQETLDFISKRETIPLEIIEKDAKLKKKFNKTIKIISDNLISNYKYKPETQYVYKKKTTGTYLEMNFPYVIKHQLGKDYKYYRLTRVQSIDGRSTIVDPITKTVSGNYAEYVETDLFGSFSQNGIGFIFGNRPTTNSILNKINDKKSPNLDDATPGLDDLTPFAPKTVTDIKSVEATENSVKVNNEPIDKSKRPSWGVNFGEESSYVDSAETSEGFDQAVTDTGETNSLDFEQPENHYDDLIAWWDQNVQNPKSEESKKIANSISNNLTIDSYEAFQEMYIKAQKENPNLSQNDFIEQIKCYL